ncbi:MAG: GNAT family N-acetyltransferase [Candidatus Heimdallarchaeaceae archaeon]
MFGMCRPDVFGSQPTMEQIKKWFKAGWAAKTLVAEYRGKVVGCMEYTALGVIGIPGILPEYQKQGIGSTLFYQLLQNMKKEGYKKAVADTGYVPYTEGAIRMYKRFEYDLSRELWTWIKILK